MRKNGSALLAAYLLILCGCAPAVRMTVEQRDGTGNVVQRFDVTNTDSEPTTFTVSSSNIIWITATAEHKDGLQRLWIEGEFKCFDPVGSSQPGGVGVSQTGTLLVPPPTGNAIPANATPTRFSFTENFPIACNRAGYEMSLRAGATSSPTTGIFGGGPATSWTQPALFRKP